MAPRQAGVQPVTVPAGNLEVTPSRSAPGAQLPSGLLPDCWAPAGAPSGLSAVRRMGARARVQWRGSSAGEGSSLLPTLNCNKGNLSRPSSLSGLSLSSALCENPALFLTGEDPGRHCTSARTQGQKGAWGEPLSGARGGFCSTGTWDLLGPVKHCCCERGSTGQVPQTPTAPVISDPFRPSLATCMGLGQLVTRAGFAPK